MFSISNDELSKCSEIGETVRCKECGQLHIVQYGEKVNEDGTREKSDLAFIKCPMSNKCYLVGIGGKEIY